MKEILKKTGTIAKDLISSLNRDPVRYGGYAAILTVGMALLLVLVNILVQQLDLKFDLTEEKLFSLSEESVNFLKGLDEDITIIALYEEGKAPRVVQEVLTLYEKASPRVHVEFMDLEKNPQLATEYEKEGERLQQGSIIVKGERTYRIIRSYDLYDINYNSPQGPEITGFSAEKRITAAIHAVTTGASPVLYELVGHREERLARYAMNDFLERENLTSKELNLLQAGEVPEDAAMVLILAPKEDLTPGEAEVLNTYLAEGGRLFVAADVQAGELPVLNELLSRYGARFDYGFVIEQDKQHHTGNPYQVVPNVEYHDITKTITQNKEALILQWTQAVKEEEIKRRNVNVTALLTSSGSSFLRKDLEREDLQRGEGDVPGPHTLAAAIEERLDDRGEKKTRIVLVGAGTLLENLYPFNAQIPGNLDFFMGGVLWCIERKDMLSIPSKSLLNLPLSLTATQVLVYSVVVVAVIPLAFFITGTIIWLRRRHL
ncbi:GldG family protein [Spirochaeta thermophila]|uniref:Uncharacterized protein n=1 Tax=Winmispira thermophila (strain ATCC 49972 / DSM 6192 / RI 19.B1) TaxID=665571 RepID=E0RU91_WINT6|nr:GldG family protein [Spirochaeta thermophila]ADN02312.1 hypothetical protein STHERM_c13720 [Spirochaeta thermophila DSM 6192]